MNKRNFIRIGAAVVLAVTLFFGLPWLSPTRGVERAWSTFIEGVEGNDFEDVAAVVDSGYGDRWGLDKPAVVALIQTGRRQFLLCSIQKEAHTVEFSPDRRRATVRSVIRVEGSGSPVAQAIVQFSKQSQTPTSFEWVRRSWKPWDWKLVALSNPDADSGVRRLQREIGKATGGLGF